MTFTAVSLSFSTIIFNAPANFWFSARSQWKFFPMVTPYSTKAGSANIVESVFSPKYSSSYRVPSYSIFPSRSIAFRAPAPSERISNSISLPDMIPTSSIGCVLVRREIIISWSAGSKDTSDTISARRRSSSFSKSSFTGVMKTPAISAHPGLIVRWSGPSEK